MACWKAYHESTSVNMECPQSNQMRRSINDLLSTSCKLHSFLPFQKDCRGPANRQMEYIWNRVQCMWIWPTPPWKISGYWTNSFGKVYWSYSEFHSSEKLWLWQVSNCPNWTIKNALREIYWLNATFSYSNGGPTASPKCSLFKSRFGQLCSAVTIAATVLCRWRNSEDLSFTASITGLLCEANLVAGPPPPDAHSCFDFYHLVMFQLCQIRYSDLNSYHLIKTLSLTQMKDGKRILHGKTKFVIHIMMANYKSRLERQQQRGEG